MNKIITGKFQKALFAAIAILILFGASSDAFGQKGMKGKYPPPDFSVISEYWDVVDYEYDFTANVPVIIVTAKKKMDVVPRYWDITWRDAQGVKISQFGTIIFSNVDVENSKVGEPIRGTSYCPWKDQMGKVKTVVVSESSTGR